MSWVSSDILPICDLRGNRRGRGPRVRRAQRSRWRPAVERLGTVAVARDGVCRVDTERGLGDIASVRFRTLGLVAAVADGGLVLVASALGNHWRRVFSGTLCTCRRMHAGAARNRFLSPLAEEYKPLWPPIRTLHRVPRFQIASCRRIGTGRGSETGCFSASEQLFFDFRIACEVRSASGVPQPMC